MKLIIFSKILVIPLLVCCSIAHVSAQKTQKIGDNPYTIDAQAVLELESATKGFLLPRMSEAQMNLITTPTEGMMLYCTDCSTNADGELRIAYNSIWQTFKGDVTGDVTGNAATVSTNANLTGPITSTGNATSIGSQTGTGVTFAMSASPTFTGTPQAPTAKAGTDDTQIATTAFAKALTTAAGANFVDLTNNQTVAGIKTMSSDLKVNGITVGVGGGDSESASYNTALGLDALVNNTGWGNTAIGRETLTVNANSNNTAVGYRALRFSVNGNNNVAFGSSALTSNTDGNINNAVGANALGNNISGSENTAVGRSALITNTIGSRNTALGNFADVTSFDLTNATAVGYSAKVTASNTIQLGNSEITDVKTAGKLTTGAITLPNTDGTIGQVLATDGSGVVTWITPNVATSSDFVDLTNNQTVAGTKTFSVDAKINSLNLGKGSGNKTTNTVFGLNALGTLNTGDYNTAIGYNAMQKNTSGNDNSAFGRLALAANQDGGTNSAFGTLALNKNSSGSYNVALGTQALRENTSGNENTAVGTNSLASNTSGKHNTAIGRVSLQANTTGEKNTGMGFQAGGNNQTGTSNSYLGYNSGLGITAGSNNTIIGANVTGLSSTLTSNIIIANGAGGTSAIKAQHDGTNWTLSGTTTASGFKTPTGTAAQFLKADGSVDSATYITSAGTATNVSGVVAIANGGTGSATQNFVDLTTAQSITGNKTFTGTVAGITPTMIGLENVDNTTDLLKPVSTATQTALDVKANLASPTFIGSPVAPTAAEGNNSTQIATTAFVSGAFETVISEGVAAQTLAIGDFVGGGVVFWVDPADNTKGLVSAVEDQSTGIQWHNGKSITTGATGTAVGTGASNTDAIIAAQGATETDYAAGLARAYNGGGFTDWFLPSKDELFQMALNKGDINTTAGANGGTNFSSGTYWSSSEASSSASRMVYWGNNHQQVYGKDGARGVRAVRAVGFPAISSLTAITAEQAAQNTAINLKAPIASPTFTGTPLALTAAAGTSTNQLATTAFVAAAASSSNFVDLTTNQSDIKGNKTFSNNLNITQNLTVTGISKSNGFHALGPKATTSQGGYLLWNLLKPGSSTFRDGFTSVVNHKGAGTGGFRFYNVSADITTADTPIVEIGSTGIIRAGAVTYTNLDGTNGQVLTTNGSGETSWSNPSAAIREVADEYSATASQTSFTLTQAPSVYSKVKMYVNGIRISNTAYSLSGSTLTYNPANNGGNSLTTGDRIQMDYYY